MKRLLRRAAGAMIRWAVVEDDGGDRGPVSWQQVRILDQSGRSVQWYPFGYFALAPAGSIAVSARMSNQPDALVHFAGSPRERPGARPGECGIYHPATGAIIRFVEDGSIVVETPGDVSVEAAGDVAVNVGGNLSALVGGTAAITAATSATVTAPSIVAAGNVNVTGNLDQDGANIGFRGSAPIAKPVINGTKTGGTAQNQLLQALHNMGIIDDQT